MDRIRDLLGRISELEAEEIGELRGLILAQIGDGEDVPEAVEMSTLQELAEASVAIQAREAQLAADAVARATAIAQLKEFKTSASPAAPPAPPAAVAPVVETPAVEPVVATSERVVAAA